MDEEGLEAKDLMEDELLFWDLPTVEDVMEVVSCAVSDFTDTGSIQDLISQGFENAE